MVVPPNHSKNKGFSITNYPKNCFFPFHGKRPIRWSYKYGVGIPDPTSLGRSSSWVYIREFCMQHAIWSLQWLCCGFRLNLKFLKMPSPWMYRSNNKTNLFWKLLLVGRRDFAWFCNWYWQIIFDFDVAGRRKRCKVFGSVAMGELRGLNWTTEMNIGNAYSGLQTSIFLAATQ